MRKLAIFVEGQTELLFLDRLLRELAVRRGLAIEHAMATGGAYRARRVRVFKQATSHRHKEFYVLIVNCGGDGRVQSDVREQSRSLANAGYSMVLGLRDVYGQFTLAQVPKLREYLSFGLEKPILPAQVFLAIMEIEAWFLAEYTHFARLDPILTRERIRQAVGFDPAVTQIETRPHPSEDLDRIYAQAGYRYSKNRQAVLRTMELLDLNVMAEKTGVQFSDFVQLLRALNEFFEG